MPLVTWVRVRKEEKVNGVKQNVLESGNMFKQAKKKKKNNRGQICPDIKIFHTE